MARKLFTKKIKDEAQLILDRVDQIAEAEQMAHVGYISALGRSHRDRRDAPCHGYQACAVGSLWLAGDVLPTRSVPTSSGMPGGPGVLPGSDVGKRHEFLTGKVDGTPKPALALAYAALNKAAELKVKSEDLRYDASFLSTSIGDKLPLDTSWAEALFEGPEGRYNGGRGRTLIRECIPMAKDLVEAVSG